MHIGSFGFGFELTWTLWPKMDEVEEGKKIIPYITVSGLQNFQKF